MSQMPQVPQSPQLSTCPSCKEPLEPGDNFCGACGAALSVAAAVPPPLPGTRLPDESGGAAAAVPPMPQQPPITGLSESMVPPDRACASHTPTLPDTPAPTSPMAGPVPPPPVVAASAAQGADGSPVPSEPYAPQWPAPASDHHAAAQEAHRPDDLATHDADDSAPASPGAHATGEGAAAASASTAGREFAESDDQPLAATAWEASGAAPEAVAAQAPADPRRAMAYGAQAAAPAAPAGPTVTDTPGGSADSRARARCVACRTGLIDSDGYCQNCGHAQPRQRDHIELQLDGVAAVTDRGLRHHRNEDAFAVSTTSLPDGSPAVVAIVCDGVSSATRPDEASEAASTAANASLLTALAQGVTPRQAMHDAILAAAQAVDSLADSGDRAPEQDPQPHHQNAPACTIVAAVVAAGILTVGWIGDSRAYWVPDDRTAPAARLTEDDSWAAQMVAAGLMSEEEAYADERAHAITGWLGADAYDIEPHTGSFEPDRPGVVVVCTDGLWNYAEAAEEMAGAVPGDARCRPMHGAQSLVGYALDGGGHDNVTVAVVPFSAAAPGAGSA
ncbi:protein phosphatase 2C domain-containing protein [Streptomyces sp. KR80]|uniref:protein phosphatase 2C domain-containing protein n=1 Tax=Streptomyces sp. KR80 TaxID=3457426 RepID=UPI003FD3DC54